MNKSFSVKLTLPCFADIELIAQCLLDQLQTIVGFSVDKLEQAKILITEAIINSVEYNSSEMNQIFIDYEFKKNELFMTIKDSGQGFTLPEISVPNLKNRMERGNYRGWGLSIMKSLSDDFSIESDQKGTKIRIYLRLND
ncbi:MAG: ATP-binding protein [Bacteroidetes bacterium]|nr:ATP-binding protein [Bacteroidota bacterium]NCQ11659.1 ATP-binding protein [Bacteroidota bacterium]